MPAVARGKILVTGANGYIAVWVIKTLLCQGYSVRGTVRRESSIPHLQKTFKDYAGKLEFVTVPDITKNGAFDDAVKGVDAIEHTASPFHYHAGDPQEVIAPAVAGTRSILQSALAHGDHVRRVVITSSTAAIFTAGNAPRTFTEADWSEDSVKEVETKSTAASPAATYRASKTLAERAAWQFVESNKGKVGFDVVTLNPPYVRGPVLHDVSRSKDLNTSMLEWYSIVVKGIKTPEQLVKESASWVDVRDIALAHVLALQKSGAGGERIVINAGPQTWQDWVNAARKVEPALPAGNTSYKVEDAVYQFRYDASKSTHILGLKYRTIDESAADTVKQFKEKGWIQ